jgi:hypothetical protein
VWTSEDGTTWTNTGVMMLYRDLLVFPDGTIVMAGASGIRAIDDPNTAIIGAAGTRDLIVQIGEFGLIGTATRNSQAKRTVLFSTGTAWSRWVPAAFESVSEPIELVLVGIGDEFVVLRQVGRQVGSQLDRLWVGTLP